jgi:predicted ATPase
LTAAREHCEQGIALYDSQRHRSLAFLYGGHDPGVCCRDFAAWALWVLGYPDQALTQSQEALTLAHDLSHPMSVGNALDFAAIVHQLRRESQAAQERAEAAIALSTGQGFPYWLVYGTLLRGWALAEQGQEEGIMQMRQGLATYKTAGWEEARSYFLALLAEACGKMGQAEEGLNVLAEALDAVCKNGERFYEAELYRLKGTLTLKQSEVRGPESRVANPQPLFPNPQAEAEAYFHKAIEIARQQQAKSLELRAVMSLSRLWQQQGKKEDARRMLAEIYSWFTEGFDTADLKEAKALLEELQRV